MSDLAFPFPNSPQNDDDFDADPVRENLEYILQILEAFPGDNITAASILEAAFASDVNPRLRSAEWESNFVVSGGLPGGFSTLTLTVPSGVARTTGYKHLIQSAGFTVAVSKDTYFSVNKNGAVDTPQAVANGAAVPTLPTDSQWLFKAISNGSTITSIVDLRALGPVSFMNTKSKTYSAQISGNTASGTDAALTGSVTVDLPAGVTAVARIMAYGPQYNNTVGQTTVLQILKNAASALTPEGIGTPAAIYTAATGANDKSMPWAHMYLTTVVNGDILRPYCRTTAGSFGGLTAVGLLTVEIIGRVV